MDMERYLNEQEDRNLLRRFAFIGMSDELNKKLKYLERLAEPEKWVFKESGHGDIYVLFYYIVHTFDQCFKQNKVAVSEDEQYASFNTGLLTSSGDEILCLFTKSTSHKPDDPKSCYWYLNKFLRESDREYIRTGLVVQDIATYFEDYNELYFDPTLRIQLGFDHIYEDNYDRLPPELQTLDKSVAKQVFDGFLNSTIKRIKRNSRIPVPQYYRDAVMFLIPVQVFGGSIVVLALEKHDNCYRANTILTMGMAYNCARLLTKPESNWLLSN